jgi:hypothetical protein
VLGCLLIFVVDSQPIQGRPPQEVIGYHCLVWLIKWWYYTCGLHLCRNGKFDKQSTKEHKRSVVTHVNVALLKLQQVSFAMTVNNHTRALAFAR